MSADAVDTWAVVTGGGTGIGRATALLLARRGIGVIVSGRTAATLDATLGAIVGAGGTGTTGVADVGTAEGVDAIADAVGGCTLVALVHAAGRDIAQAFTETTRDDLAEMLATDVYAPFFVTQRLLPRLADGAGVVFVGSISARHGRDRHAGYGAAKAALIGLTANLAVELGPRVRVNCVSPGATRTAMLRDYVRASTSHLSDEQKAIVGVQDAARLVLGRVAEPAEVAATIVHLALDATSITGVDLPVDVGYSAS